MPRLIIHGCKLSEPQLTGLSFSFTDTAFDISFFSLPISVSARECRYLWTISISILFYRLTEVYRHVCFLETLSIEWEFSITRSLLIVRFCYEWKLSYFWTVEILCGIRDDGKTCNYNERGSLKRVNVLIF